VNEEAIAALGCRVRENKGTINSSDRIAATLYSLGTLFVSGIYV
jgi:hypothetical protein